MAERYGPTELTIEQIAETCGRAVGRDDAVCKLNAMSSHRDPMTKLEIIGAALHQRFESSDLGKVGSCRRHCCTECEPDAFEAASHENPRGKVGGNANRFQI